MFKVSKFIDSRYFAFQVEDCGIGEPEKAFVGFNPPAGWDANFKKNSSKEQANPRHCGIEDEPVHFNPPTGWDARSSSSMEKKPVLDAFGDDISQASGYGSFSKAVKKSKFKAGDRVRVRTPRSARGAISPSGEVGEVTRVDCNSESCAIRVHRPTGESWSIEDFSNLELVA